MGTDTLVLAVDYLRLSDEEANAGESSSIVNQRKLIKSYCEQNGITLVREFVDDGWSGGNFQRPGFQSMLRLLEKGQVNMVITKDLSRLGRDMREASYYAEQFFPERGIRFLTVSDNFDTERDNVLAPFQFAMNEVYLRDGSRKVKDVLRNKRENGEYCACPPYGYRRDEQDRTRLTPDEMTAPVVQRIFARAAKGDSTRQIALDLTADGILPPLKYRILYTGNFKEGSAAKVSDQWNYTTVKRILKNPVYLGHTILGKSKKVSFKSKVKVAVPKESWAVTRNTHPPLVSQLDYDRAQKNLGRGTKTFLAYDQVRKSIFSGVAVCAKCGYALCSCGTVYKGEREKYWYLSCNHRRKELANPCEGVRIRYSDLLELVRQDLNALLSLEPGEIDELVQNVLKKSGSADTLREKALQKEKAEARLATIDRIIGKLYTDNAEGKLDDDRLDRMVAGLQQESQGLKAILQAAEQDAKDLETEKNFQRFFDLVKQYTHLEVLDRDTLITFVDRIEVGPKELPPGVEKTTHRNQPYRQNVRIFYKFIGELASDPMIEFPRETQEAKQKVLL